MKKFLIFCMAVTYIGSVIFAQQLEATISFKESEFNFGTFKAADGPVNHTFEFTNTGSTPLIIQNVETSCGCTTPEYTKQPVLPGAKGFVKVAFNPEGRSGQFEKTITIKSNASKPTEILKISGTIIPKAIQPQDEYRFPIGDLRLKVGQVIFGNILPNETKVQTIDLMNSGQATVQIELISVPAHLTVKVLPTTLKPNQGGSIIIIYDAKKKNDWDFLIDYLYFKLNGKTDPNYRLTITATIAEDNSKLTPQQLADAPKVFFENAVFNFGTIKQGQKVSHEFKFKNEGKSNLVIRKVTTSCGCTTINPNDKEIKPGESSSLTAVFDSSGKMGEQNKSIVIVTNDPKKQKITLSITGKVEQ
jgi:hypothetical protein